MNVITVGALDEDVLEELRERPAVILVGTVDEIRAAGALLYTEVEITPAKGSQKEKVR